MEDTSAEFSKLGVQEELLYNADPDCDHEVVARDSGVKCVKCPGWFCY